MLLFQKETFGPIVTIMKGFDGTEELAVQCCNDTEYGLGSCVYSKDIEKCNFSWVYVLASHFVGE